MSRRVLTAIEIKALKKGLTFAPIQNKINEPELRFDFETFSWRMITKCQFRIELTLILSDSLSFRPKSTWKLPSGNPNIIRKRNFYT